MLTATAPILREGLQLVGSSLFIGVTLGVLLFIAATSTLYVKIFTQVSDDRRQMVALRRVGYTNSEIDSVVSRELRTLFFVPVGVAILHAAVMMGGFLTVTPSSTGIWQAFAVSAAAYTLIFGAYSLIARSNYRKLLAH